MELLIIVAVFGFAIVVFNLVRQIGSHFGWKHVADASALDEQATIVDVKTAEVKYNKNDAKYRTLITFSDGFEYTSHKTDREQGIFSYKIYLSKALMKEIILDAIESHDEALKKHKKIAITERSEEEIAKIVGTEIYLTLFKKEPEKPRPVYKWTCSHCGFADNGVNDYLCKQCGKGK